MGGQPTSDTLVSIYDIIEGFKKDASIDDTSNLLGSKVYNFHGTLDAIVSERK